jgi:predicted nucleic acid-binding protein
VITAVDSNVLVDVFQADSRFGRRSADALERSLAEGAVVACEVVWSEVVAAFGSATAATDALARIGVAYDPLTALAAAHAGGAWRAYRDRGGPRTRMIADFLVAAHAEQQADRLLTRDRGFYRRAFGELELVDPTGK